MSTGDTQDNLDNIFRAAASECTKLGVPAIMPWRMDANQDHSHKGIEQCGCAFCPDDGQETT